MRTQNMTEQMPRAPRKLRIGRYSLLCRPWNKEHLFGRSAYWTSGGGVPAKQEKVLESFHLWPFELTWPARRGCLVSQSLGDGVMESTSYAEASEVKMLREGDLS